MISPRTQFVALVIAFVLAGQPVAAPCAWASAAASSSAIRSHATRTDARTSATLEAALRAPGSSGYSYMKIRRWLQQLSRMGKVHEQPIPVSVHSLIEQHTQVIFYPPVQFYMVDLGEQLGFPRAQQTDQRVLPQDILYAVHTWGSDAALQVYVTKAFYERHLLRDELLFAEVLYHEYAEARIHYLETRSHRKAAQDAWQFARGSWGLSPFYEFYLNLLAAHGQFEALRRFKRAHGHDLDGRFYAYAQHLANTIGHEAGAEPVRETLLNSAGESFEDVVAAARAARGFVDEATIDEALASLHHPPSADDEQRYAASFARMSLEELGQTLASFPTLLHLLQKAPTDNVALLRALLDSLTKDGDSAFLRHFILSPRVGIEACTSDLEHTSALDKRVPALQEQLQYQFQVSAFIRELFLHRWKKPSPGPAGSPPAAQGTAGAVGAISHTHSNL